MPTAAILLLLGIWQAVCTFGGVPSFMLPPPAKVAETLVREFPTLWGHARITLVETFIGLGLGVLIGFLTAVLMDRFQPLYHAFYPLIVISQTIPTVAIAPLLVLWFGYDMLPKVLLIILITFFPITVNLIAGYRSADKDTINLMRSMGAGRLQIFRHVKMPCALDNFFSALKISVSYAVVGAVIAEWLGGFNGLGVYMTRVRKSYSFSKMFAVIILISAFSLILILAVSLLQKKCMPWKKKGEQHN